MKIRPTGLKGNDKIQRIQNLMDKLSPLNESVSNSTLEHVKYGPDGTTYGIVRENHNYFIKVSNKRNSKLTSEDFNYIGGLQNKMNESYKSYEEALKHLNLRFRDLNESYGIRENINLFRSDVLLESKKKSVKKEQEEETKYTLKVDSPEGGDEDMSMGVATDTATTPDMSTTEVPADDTTSPDMSTTEVPADDTVTPDMGTTEPVEGGDTETPEVSDVPDETEEGGDEESGDVEKDIQRLTGKIGQKMRELDEPNPELEKYVINSIMSALDVDSMEDEFKEELISKLEGEETEEEPTEEEPTEEVPTEEEPVEGEETEEVETETTSEGRVFSKKRLIENLKSKKILKNKLKRSIKESDEFYGKFRDMDGEWLSNLSNKRSKLSDTDGWEEEEFKDYESFSSKHPKHAWFSGPHNPKGSKRMFNHYKDKFGPLKTRRHKMLKNPNLPDDEEFLDEITQMSVIDPKTDKFSGLKPGPYGLKDDQGNMRSIEIKEEDKIYEIELDEDWVEEGNKFTDMLRRTPKGGSFKIGGREYKDTSDYDTPKKHKRKHMDEDEEMLDFYDDYSDDYSDDYGNRSDRFIDILSKSPDEEEEYEEVETLPDTDDPYITPDEDEPFNPFKPKIKPKIQPKGRMGMKYGEDEEYYV